MATSSRQQPPWQQPKASAERALPPLRIWNSLTRSKTPFIPTDPSGQEVTWYACGPTVYDDAHLGHARTYLTSDIIRRIVRDYFGFKVRYVMNITDVDDKIILRARQQYLLQKFRQEHGQETSTLNDALKYYISKNLEAQPEEATAAEIHTTLSQTYKDLLNRNTTDDAEAKKMMHVKTSITAAKALMAIEGRTNPAISTKEDSKDLDDVLMLYLDSKHGSSVDAKDHSIFTRLTQRHEGKFTEDMRALNVQDPEDVTRVTEYVPQIVDFVLRIQSNGFAYQTSSGVYFDVDGFEKANNHYARLEPWNRNDVSLQADGEGAISGKDMKKGGREKRSQADFALWKLSKPGEPSWPSPWGEGRPGWHIECSAMASDKLGKQLDIHSGGIDLAFPHHDNELAQSEAYWNDGKHVHQWVNYFMHMGHLSISGAKMSKSLKNFTTIRDALRQGTWTSRSLRIVLLLGGWNQGVEITDQLVRMGIAWEDKLNNFFLKVKDVVDEDSPDRLEGLALNESSYSSLLHPSQQPKDGALIEAIEPESTPKLLLTEALEKAKSKTYLALCDSFNTAAVMSLISELVSIYNSADPDPGPSAEDTTEVARWITAMINVFGLNGAATPSDPKLGWSGLDIAPEIRPILSAISTLRDTIRAKARSSTGLTPADINSAIMASENQTWQITDSTQPFIDILHSFHTSLRALNAPNPANQPLSKSALALCDTIRDTSLWHRGIYLEDPPSSLPTTNARIRPLTREMRAQRLEKEAREAAKAQAKRDQQEAEMARVEKGRLSHLEMFKIGEVAGEFSAWDEEGMPVRDAEGAEIGKSRGKKLRKEWERQRRLHEEWVKGQEGKGREE